MSNIAILCSGGDDTSRQEKMRNLIFLVSKIRLIETSPYSLNISDSYTKESL